MWHAIVLKADTAIGRLMLGFLDTCSSHPVPTAGVLAVLMALAVMMWIEMFKDEQRPGAASATAVPSSHR